MKGFWLVTRKEAEDVKAQLRNVERQREELKEACQVQTQEAQHRISHLLYELTNELARSKTDSYVALARAQDEERASERELLHDERVMKQRKKEQELAHLELLHRMRLDRERRTTDTQRSYEHRSMELQEKYKKMCENVRREMDQKRLDDIKRLNEFKKNHIETIISSHNKAFSEIKHNFTTGTHCVDPFLVIEQLKSTLSEKKKEEAVQRKMQNLTTQELRRVQEPLEAAKREYLRLKDKLKSYKKDKATLQERKQELGSLQAQLESLAWEHEVLQQRYGQVERELADLNAQFQKAIYHIVQADSFHGLLLEKKLDLLEEVVEKKDAQLSEILAASNLEPTVANEVSQGLQEILQAKNTEIRQLQDDLRRLTKAHQDVIRFYEAKMKEFGIPLEELGFQPLVTHVVVPAAPMPPPGPPPPTFVAPEGATMATVQPGDLAVTSTGTDAPEILPPAPEATATATMATESVGTS
eukprot:GAFH01001438.1.p1 GENE.GAFH01001438.1~~GAFH01001438.1.p1  ORF type:complete len:472 (-),score=202.69 GAFH01001438.1:80-1495(-)